MRKLILSLALLSLALPGCKSDEEKAGATPTSSQANYACYKCGKTKTAPASQAPS